MGIVTTKNRLIGEDNMSYNLYKTKFETAKNNYFITRELKKLYGKNNYSFRDFINLHKKYCILHALNGFQPKFFQGIEQKIEWFYG